MSRQCRSCGAEVLFVPSAKSGKPMILDAKPEKRIVLVVGGHENLIAQPETAIYMARVVNTYTDHHATCPKAAEWKGRRR